MRLEAQLEKDLLHVRLDGSLGYEEPSGDRLVREAFRDKFENFSLALGQVGERVLSAATADEA